MKVCFRNKPLQLIFPEPERRRKKKKVLRYWHPGCDKCKLDKPEWSNSGWPGSPEPAGGEADFGARLLTGAAFIARVTLPGFFSISSINEWNTSLQITGVVCGRSTVVIFSRREERKAKKYVTFLNQTHTKKSLSGSVSFCFTFSAHLSCLEIPLSVTAGTASPRNTNNWRGRLSTDGLLTKVACFVKKINMFSIKRS